MKTLTITETAEYIGVCRRTLMRMIMDGRFPVKPIAGTRPRRWSVDQINEWVSAK